MVPRWYGCRFAAIAALVLVSSFACEAPQEALQQTRRAVGGVERTAVVASATGAAIGDEVIVRVRPEVEVAALAAAYGGRIAWHATRVDRYALRFDDAEAASRAADALSSDPQVLDVAKNRVTTGTGIGTSPIELRRLQWNLAALRLSTNTSGRSAEGVVVAVLDTGLAYEDYADERGSYQLAPDLAEVELVAGYDFVNDDAHPNDDNGHGTHVAGVIAASSGIAAIAPEVDIMPIKVLDADNRGTELALTEGIFFAVDHGADVINLSLAFPPEYFPSRYLQAAIDYASAAGVIIVAAAGNDGADTVSYPAAFRDVIAVGGSRLASGYPKMATRGWWLADWLLTPAAYSNRGYLLDVLAPGGDLASDVDRDGNPEAVLAQTLGEGGGFDYRFYAGTSQAAAQISGLAALMRAKNPQLSPAQVRAALGDTARQTGFLALSRTTGRGFVRADRALQLAAAGPAAATELGASVYLSLHDYGFGPIARAEVEVLDGAGNPVPMALVYATFSGGASASSAWLTGADGRATFYSPVLADELPLAAFQVDAVEVRNEGVRRLERPRGAMRIDSCSLQALADFSTSGAGIGTSPLTVRYQLGDAKSSELAAVSLVNFSWALATVPMAVAARADWFAGQFPGYESSSVVSTGSGIGTSPITIQLQRAGLPGDAVPAAECIELILSTYNGGAGIGTSPYRMQAACEDCAAVDATLAELWSFHVSGAGIGTSPVWQASRGISLELFEQLARMMSSYATFGGLAAGTSVGDYGRLLEAAGARAGVAAEHAGLEIP